MIDIVVNGEPKHISAMTVSELIRQHGLNALTVIVELGGDILAKDAYDDTTLESGDRIELIQFVGGG